MTRIPIALAGLAAALTLAGASAAQAPDPALINTTIPEDGAPLAVAGPYEVVIEEAAGSPGHTIYRPAALDAFPGADTLPVVAWGNGGCAASSAYFAGFLTTLASHGFLVVTTSARADDPRARATADELIAGVDWAERESAREGSPLERKIATDSIAVMGQSCGGWLTLMLAADPRVDTIGVWNTGASEVGAIPGAATPAHRAAVHSPALYISGHERDFMAPAAVADFDAIDNVPIFYGARIGGGHLATFAHAGGGEFANVAVAWLEWTLKGDEAAGRMFVGEDCGLCADPNWETASKGLD
jgi:predicted alpha/beta-hydrolase family hydrolase